jgi:signal transduction histidine kinase
MRWTLNRKLVFIMVVLSSLLIGVMYLFNEYYERQLYMSITGKTRDLIRSIQLAVEEMTKKDHDDMKLFHFLKEIRSEGISEIHIIDSALKIAESTNPDKVGHELSRETTELLFKSEEGKLVTEKGDFFNIIIPVVTKGEHQGYIHIVIDSRDVKSFMDENDKKRMSASALILFAGIIIAIWLSRHYTRPIKEVVSAARSVAAGDLDLNLTVNEKDEIGELKESFNQMIKRLIELRQLRDRLRETEHLSTVGELSSSVAHEIRNPLNFISLSVDHLIDKPVDESSKELLQRIKQEIKRLDSLVGNFLAYGKPLKIVPKPVKIINLIEETLSLVYARAEKVGVEIVKKYDIDDVTIEADPELIKTCLFNVFQNSFQAMPDGGELTIAVISENNSTILSMSDTGSGLDEKIIGKVFEPFFTTRERGLGLGLAMTKRVIEEHGGMVSFRSSAGNGSTVEFILPTGNN